MSDEMAAATVRALRDAAGNPEVVPAVLPLDPRTRQVITDALDAWWASLTPAQRMTVYLRAGYTVAWHSSGDA